MHTLTCSVSVSAERGEVGELVLFACSTYHLLVVVEASSNSTGKGVIAPLFTFCISLGNSESFCGVLTQMFRLRISNLHSCCLYGNRSLLSHPPTYFFPFFCISFEMRGQELRTASRMYALWIDVLA